MLPPSRKVPVDTIQDTTHYTVGWVKFSEWKKQVVVVAKYIEDPKIIFFKSF